jgi:hypothetical protein
MGSGVWEQTAVIVAVVSPLVGVPLGMITLYLKAIRDHQTTATAELTRRIEAIEGAMRDLLERLAGFEREYTSKEEWVRESMLARQQLERLTEMTAGIQADLESKMSVSSEIGRAAAAIVAAIEEGKHPSNA